MPEVLKSAAHAMKHREETQASGVYDQNADTKLVKAAYDFNLAFAAQFARVPDSGYPGWLLVPGQPADGFVFQPAEGENIYNLFIPFISGLTAGSVVWVPVVPGTVNGVGVFDPTTGTFEPAGQASITLRASRTSKPRT